MMKKFLLSCLALISFFPVATFAQINVSYSGCVEQPGVLGFQTSPTLLQAVKQVKIKPCAYLYGAALMRPALSEKQKDQKQNLLTALSASLSQTDLSQELHDYLQKLISIIRSQPVTGRDIRYGLFPTLVEVKKNANPIIDEPISIHYPQRPTTIDLIGFEQSRTQYNPDLSVEQMVNELTLLPVLEKGYLVVIQANGLAKKIRIGSWSNDVNYVSPGGWLVGLLPSSVMGNERQQLNSMLIYWLSTQVIKE
ncbi:capsule biosynthesis GfcC D2 domain-containing protein [Thiomicrorhabdus heinhorstiae]|nr:capsule biosynthesis GfcC D2 domain-containing protein [Thiomicrorhabdus heinhorstiae]